MNPVHQTKLAAHLRCHARTLHRLACGFGRHRDADDILQTLYTRWCKRVQSEPEWQPPSTHVELFVAVRRVVMDIVAMEERQRALLERVDGWSRLADSPEESLHAFDRLQWVFAKMPSQLAEALQAGLASGRRSDAAVAAELGVTVSTFTMRLFKARRVAEELASFFELLPLDQANLLADLRFGDKSRSALARDAGISMDELSARWRSALDEIEATRKSRVAS